MSAAQVVFAAAAFGFCAAGVGALVQGAMIPIEAQVAQVELRHDFEQALAERVPASPPSARPAVVTARLPLAAASSPATPVAAGKPLARITVKRLEVEDIVLAGPASHDDLARGPTMLKRGDAESPVTVLAAHRDTHFQFIRDLREGDVVGLQYVSGEVERYRVSHFETVRWDHFAYPLDPPRALLALTTCYPFGGSEYGGPWRRIAWAERIS